MLGVRVCTYVLYLRRAGARIRPNCCGFRRFVSLIVTGRVMKAAGYNPYDSSGEFARNQPVLIILMIDFPPRILVLLGQFVFQTDCMMPCFLRLIYLLPLSKRNKI